MPPRNLAQRAAHWSSQHRGIAVFGWLALGIGELVGAQNRARRARRRLVIVRGDDTPVAAILHMTEIDRGLETTSDPARIGSAPDAARDPGRRVPDQAQAQSFSVTLSPATSTRTVTAAPSSRARLTR
jgi:hypothetical protein